MSPVLPFGLHNGVVPGGGGSAVPTCQHHRVHLAPSCAPGRGQGRRRKCSHVEEAAAPCSGAQASGRPRCQEDATSGPRPREEEGRTHSHGGRACRPDQQGAQGSAEGFAPVAGRNTLSSPLKKQIRAESPPPPGCRQRQGPDELCAQRPPPTPALPFITRSCQMQMGLRVVLLPSETQDLRN